jgi:Helix-turn-helix domain
MSTNKSQLKSVSSRLFSIEDAASICGSISPWTLRKHIASGAIRVIRIGRRVFLPSEEIERIRRDGLPSLRFTGAGVSETHNSNSKNGESSHV